MSANRIEYSEKYADEDNEYRHVILPKDLAKSLPKNRLLTESEWRGIGVQQSRGWVHYAIHRPEPHIMLYRCVSRPHDAGGFASLVSRACFSNGSGRRASAVASQRRPAIASAPR